MNRTSFQTLELKKFVVLALFACCVASVAHTASGAESSSPLPFDAPTGERSGVKDPEKGQRRCIVVVPKAAAPGNPWSWRGCYWDHQPQTEIELLKRSFHIAYTSADQNLKPGRQWDAWYEFLTESHGFSKKPVMEGAGGAAREAYAWAIENPDKVSCIYAENPVMHSNTAKTQPLDKLAPLAKAGVPLLHVCGNLDPYFKDNTQVLEKLYKKLGGEIKVIIKKGEGHYPLPPKDPKPVVELIIQNSQQVGL